MGFDRVYRERDKDFPQFEFEFHPGTGKVYVMGLPGRFSGGVFVTKPGTPTKGFVLAEGCDHHARFLGLVRAYLRGYRQGYHDRKVRTKSLGGSNADSRPGS